MPLDPNASDIEAIKTALVRFMRDRLFAGEELVLKEPVHGPRPGVLHATVRFFSARPLLNEVSEYDYDAEADEVTESLRGERYCRVRVSFFGVGANQKAVDCQNLFRSNLAIFALAPITGFGEVGEVQDITLENLAYQEERATFTVELYANLAGQFEAQFIDAIEGDIVREGKPYPYEVNRNT